MMYILTLKFQMKSWKRQWLNFKSNFYLGAVVKKTIAPFSFTIFKGKAAFEIDKAYLVGYNIFRYLVLVIISNFCRMLYSL